MELVPSLEIFNLKPIKTILSFSCFFHQKKQVSSRSQPSMSRLQPLRAVHDFSSMSKRRGVSQTNLSPNPAPAHAAALGVSKPLRNLRRLSLPLRPVNHAPKPAPPGSPPRLRSQVLKEEQEDALPHTPPTSCIPTLRPTSITKMRRTLSGSVQKPWRTLRGSLRAKVADQVRASVMRGKQDYALPNETGQLEYLRFLTAQQARSGHVTQRRVSEALSLCRPRKKVVEIR